jgi:hypothetical protein
LTGEKLQIHICCCLRKKIRNKQSRLASLSAGYSIKAHEQGNRSDGAVMAHKFVGGFSRLTGILGQTGEQRPKIDYLKKYSTVA